MSFNELMELNEKINLKYELIDYIMEYTFRYADFEKATDDEKREIARDAKNEAFKNLEAKIKDILKIKD